MDINEGGPQRPQEPRNTHDGGTEPGVGQAPPAPGRQGGAPAAGAPGGYGYAGGPAPAPAAAVGAGFFGWLRGLGVRRGSERWIGGVASGLAERWGIDPVIVRGLIVLLSLFFGVGVLAYGLAWALLPEPDGRIHAEEALRGRWSTGMTGAVVFTALGLLGPGRGLVFGGNDGWFPWPLFWIAGIVGIIVWAVNRDKNRNGAATGPGRPMGASMGAPPPPAPPYTAWSAGAQGTMPPQAPPTAPPMPPASGQGPWNGTSSFTATAERVGHGINDWSQRTLGPEGPLGPNGALGPNGPLAPRRHPRWGAGAVALSLGLAILAGAGVLLLDSAGLIALGGYAVATAFATAAAVLGLAVVVAGLRGRTSGLPGFLSLMALLVAIALSVVPTAGSWSLARSQNWAPSSISAAGDGFSIAMGQGSLDLSALGDSAPLPERTVVPVNFAAAEVEITIPSNIPVVVQSEVAAVSISYDGERSNGVAVGTGSTTTLNPEAKGPALVLQLRGAAGSINIATTQK
ncbi:PspC domain-containing protein [Arthrobacter sp. 35W]|uniref:PspC domain-containing protein n=1 Tax=Arthrobacter sp. 35W TaxID=1132441 RepID=UPI000416EB4C|nr:PspC domain-containing protein [Arthrobacter sp. 35W]